MFLYISQTYFWYFFCSGKNLSTGCMRCVKFYHSSLSYQHVGLLASPFRYLFCLCCLCHINLSSDSSTAQHVLCKCPEHCCGAAVGFLLSVLPFSDLMLKISTAVFVLCQFKRNLYPLDKKPFNNLIFIYYMSISDRLQHCCFSMLES